MREHNLKLKTLLVSAPFTAPYGPQLGLGILKSFLASKGWSADCLYLPLYLLRFLKSSEYYKASEFGVFGEGWYSHFLFDSQKDQNYLKQQMFSFFGNNDERDLIFKAIRRFNAYVRSELFRKRYDVIGFSVRQGQLTASLFFSRLYKSLHPTSKIIFGGPQCSGDLGRTLINTFPWIDYVVHGEGELAFLGIMNSLKEKRAHHMPGCSLRIDGAVVSDFHCKAVTNLNTLPMPDFTDYFVQYKRCGSPCRVVEIPIELNRGCWWGKCAFCGHHMYRRYREISPQNICRTMEALSGQHNILTFHFVSNIGYRSLLSLVKNLKRLKKEYSIMMNHRATISREEIKALGEAGLKVLLLGIESLSTSLLKKMRKGVTAIENIQALKFARELNVEVNCPLISGFPGETKKEFNETIDNIKTSWHLIHPFMEQPLSLYYDSEMFRNKRCFGLKDVVPSEIFKTVFPPRFFNKLTHYIYDFKTSSQQLGSYRRTLKAEGWNGSNDPRLTYQDGDSFLVIIDTRKKNSIIEHRYQGLERELYLFCTRIRTLSDIDRQFKDAKQPGTPTPKRVIAALRRFCKDSLMIKEGERYLSLATHNRTYHQIT